LIICITRIKILQLNFAARIHLPNVIHRYSASFWL
jgi:hypothetical protein